MSAPTGIGICTASHDTLSGAEILGPWCKGRVWQEQRRVSLAYGLMSRRSIVQIALLVELLTKRSVTEIALSLFPL